MHTIPEMIDMREREEWLDRADRWITLLRSAVIGGLIGVLFAMAAYKAIGLYVAASLSEAAPVGW